jgi:hypothetical protein
MAGVISARLALTDCAAKDQEDQQTKNRLQSSDDQQSDIMPAFPEKPTQPCDEKT